MTAPRLAKLDPATLDDQQREVYDAVASGPRAAGPQLFRLVDEAGRLEGPFNAFLLQPRLGLEAFQLLLHPGAIGGLCGDRQSTEHQGQRKFHGGRA